MTSERFERIEGLFHAALKIPAAQRRGFLKKMCPQDDSLRDEVELLLAEDANIADAVQASLEETRRSSLRIGTRLGRYEITRAIGTGAMGEVYRGRDTKLGRDIALKILSERFADDPERIARFRREAQLLALLNHPNIAAIYGLEESSGLVAIAMELVEGVTLAERIATGAIPLEEALDIAKQISEGLDATHERGIIHRDLKPANVKITPAGGVKILDFGLGKDVKAERRTGDLPATQHGLILGTAPYMSPEQARGAPADRRADIWAFGVVLYEMLTGQRLFARETISDTLAAVLTKEPDWTGAPAATRRLLRQCLEKDPKRRLRDIADAWALLDHVTGPEPTRVKQKRYRKWAGAAAFVLVFAGWAAWRAPRSTEPALQPLVRLNVNLGDDVSLGSRRGADVILSPDGQRLVYVAQSRLFTRRLDQAASTALAGTAQAYAPFFSPDGQWVGFFADHKLKKVSVDGGPPIDVCDAPSGDGGSWGEDGDIIASVDGNGLSHISSNGGAPARITELAPGEEIHRWPQILPRANAVLFSAFASLSGPNGASIEVVSLRDRRRKTLMRGGTWARYVPDGKLIYIEDGTLLAVPFDPDRLETHGAPVRMLEGIAYSSASGTAQVDVSRSGALVYRNGGATAGLVRIELLDGSGTTKPLLRNDGDYLSPVLSPDAKELALVSGGDVWVYDLRRDTMTRLTFAGGLSNVVWTRDSKYLMFRAAEGMFWTRADGSGTPQPFTRSSNRQTPWSFTSDGKRLAFVEITPISGADIWTVPVESEAGGLKAGTPQVFLQTRFNERAPAFSPDGRWIAYFSDESGKSQVYVRAFRDAAAGAGSKWQISRDEGSSPVWSLNGRELLFRNENNQLMAVAYRVNGDVFVADEPRLWSHEKLAITRGSRGYDSAPDGKSVVAAIPVADAEPARPQHEIVFLLNFSHELRRRIPRQGPSPQ